LGLENNVHVLGFRQDVLHILCGADLCIHPTLAEAHPRALLESLAAGVPVVAYNVGGVKEALVDCETGYLVPVGDVEQLAKRTEQLIADPNLRYKFGQMGRKIAQSRFSVERTSDEVFHVIEKVLQS